MGMVQRSGRGPIGTMPSTPAAQLQDLGLYLKYKTFDAMSLDRKSAIDHCGLTLACSMERSVPVVVQESGPGNQYQSRINAWFRLGCIFPPW